MKGIILLAGGKPKSGDSRSNPFEGSDEEEAEESKSEAKAEGDDDYSGDEEALAKKAGITDLAAFKKLLKVCSESE